MIKTVRAAGLLRLLPAALFVALLLLPGKASAQSMGAEFDRSRYSAASYYNYAEPGDVTILVNVWGTVRNPGLYEVPQGTAMSTLLSVAGGPAIQPRNPRQERSIIVSLTRVENGEANVILETTMEDQILAAPEDPVLMEGDVLAVDTVTRVRFNWRDVFPVISSISSVAVAIFYLARL